MGKMESNLIQICYYLKLGKLLRDRNSIFYGICVKLDNKAIENMLSAADSDYIAVRSVLRYIRKAGA